MCSKYVLCTSLFVAEHDAVRDVKERRQRVLFCGTDLSVTTPPGGGPASVLRSSYLPEVAAGFSHTALTNPGSPAESHTASRTHALPVASNGIEKCLLPNAGRSVAEMICRSTFLPSPHTTSTKSSGNVQSMSATIVRLFPEPSTAKFFTRISPVVTKEFPSLMAFR